MRPYIQNGHWRRAVYSTCNFPRKGEFIYLYDRESLSCCVVVDEVAIRNSNNDRNLKVVTHNLRSQLKNGDANHTSRGVMLHFM